MSVLSQRTLVTLFRVGTVLVNTGGNGITIKRDDFDIGCILENA